MCIYSHTHIYYIDMYMNMYVSMTWLRCHPSVYTGMHMYHVYVHVCFCSNWTHTHTHTHTHTQTLLIFFLKNRCRWGKSEEEEWRDGPPRIFQAHLVSIWIYIYIYCIYSYVYLLSILCGSCRHVSFYVYRIFQENSIGGRNIAHKKVRVGGCCSSLLLQCVAVCCSV